MFSFFDMAAIVVTFAALLSWINNKYLPLSPTAGLLALSAGASGLLILAHFLIPILALLRALRRADAQHRFRRCRDGRHSRLPAVRRRHQHRSSRPAPTAAGHRDARHFRHDDFGPHHWRRRVGDRALYRRDLPLAVGAGVRRRHQPDRSRRGSQHARNVEMPERLRVELQGESLFNDGIEIVLFTLFLRSRSAHEGDQPAVSGIRIAGGGSGRRHIARPLSPATSPIGRCAASMITRSKS